MKQILVFLIPISVCAAIALIILLWMLARHRSLSVEERSREIRRKKRHKKHSSHHHRKYAKRNPTLAETGGLPPPRPPGAPLFPPLNAK